MNALQLTTLDRVILGALHADRGIRAQAVAHALERHLRRRTWLPERGVVRPETAAEAHRTLTGAEHLGLCECRNGYWRITTAGQRALQTRSVPA